MNTDGKRLTLVRETQDEQGNYGEKTPIRNDRNKHPLLLSDETQNPKSFNPENE